MKQFASQSWIAWMVTTCTATKSWRPQANLNRNSWIFVVAALMLIVISRNQRSKMTSLSCQSRLTTIPLRLWVKLCRRRMTPRCLVSKTWKERTLKSPKMKVFRSLTSGSSRSAHLSSTACMACSTMRWCRTTTRSFRCLCLQNRWAPKSRVCHCKFPHHVTSKRTKVFCLEKKMPTSKSWSERLFNKQMYNT